MYLDDKLVFLAGSSILKYILNNYPKTKIRAAYHRTKPLIKDERVDYARWMLICRCLI